MAYEWDCSKVRKSYRVKMAVMCVVALMLAAAPLILIVIGLE